MAATAIARRNRFDTPARYKQRVGVYVASSAGSAPTTADLQTSIICESIEKRAGSALWRATFRVDLGRQNRNIENRKLTNEASRQVEVWTLKQNVDKSDDDIRETPLFWGELLGNSIRIDDGQSEIWTALVSPTMHFGEPVEGQLVYNVATAAIETTNLDLEFNPEVDHEIVFNKWPDTHANNSKLYPIWIDPESTRSQTALDNHGGDNAEWSLSDIIETLIYWKNADETNVKNISRDKLEDALSAAPKVRNLIYSLGGHIPDYLDQLCTPHGYGWYLEHMDDDTGTGAEPILRFYKRGEGAEKKIRLQRWGADYAPTKDEAEIIDVNYDFSQCVNRLRVQGALIEREVTVELYRGWESSDDSNFAADDVTNKIGRLWIANEGGDYTDLRTEISAIPSFGTDFGPPRKRVIEDCLTLRNGHRQPPFVEISTDNGSTWNPLETLGETGDDASSFSAYRVLPNEIGIYLTGTGDNAFPAPLDETAEANLRVRITGTITSEFRLEHRTDPSNDSPISGNAEAIIRAYDQFHDRQRLASGDNASVLTGDADTRDDTTAIEDYADRLLEDMTSAQITAGVRLFGLNFDYQIGDILTDVDGRGISFKRSSDSAATAKYVQVVGINYECSEQQSTTLIVQQYDV